MGNRVHSGYEDDPTRGPTTAKTLFEDAKGLVAHAKALLSQVAVLNREAGELADVSAATAVSDLATMETALATAASTGRMDG